ncbi:MAG: DUF1273 domain-containing protein [Acetilactobacillus jinshanensis]
MKKADDNMKRLWVTGYRSYELNVFKDKDPKVKVFKSVMKDQISQAVINGFTWFITGAQLGVEQWFVEDATSLKKKYSHQYQIAVMEPFAHFGNRWGDRNQIRLAKTIKRADFSRPVSNSGYTSPQQLFNYQAFMLNHTDAALLIYDSDYPGKTKYDYTKINQYAKNHQYPLTTITMDDLEDAAEDYEAAYREKHRGDLQRKQHLL